ncbi:MAG: hypothetical protein II606_07715, partial [Erysipelotrichaceae bacterium]|nr:hypothetical protein [Erysipelotrichaceae bacterium]
MDQIITSLLENDLYKFSMGQAIYHHFSDYKTTWTFKCRNKDVVFSDDVVEEIKHQIRMYCALRFDEEELEYLHNIRWIKGSYVDFLSQDQFRPLNGPAVPRGCRSDTGRGELRRVLRRLPGRAAVGS